MGRQLEESFDVVDEDGKRYTIQCWRDLDAGREFRDTMKQWLASKPMYVSSRGEPALPVADKPGWFDLGEASIRACRVPSI